MEKIKVMVTGIKGAMGTEIAKYLSQLRDEFELIPTSYVSQDTTALDHRVPGVEKSFVLIKPAMRDEDIEHLKEIYGPFIAVDFARDKKNPNVPNEMADFYCRHVVPFVMGSTGGDRPALEERIKQSDIAAVVAPNMALEIVAFQLAMREFSLAHEGVLKECILEIVESHQQGKSDTSGTAKAVVKDFNVMGISYSVEAIKKIREPAVQRKMGIPEEFLSGHAWHTYTLMDKNGQRNEGLFLLKNTLTDFLHQSPVFRAYTLSQLKIGSFVNLERMSPDFNTVFSIVTPTGRGYLKESSQLSFSHNVNGRGIYLPGVAQALRFEHQRVQAGDKGKMYDMIPVLRAM